METFLYENSKKQNSDFNVLMAFPGSYAFAMSSIGYLWLFRTLDELENVNVERIYSNTVKTKLDVRKVDIIGFSFSFDLDFINIFSMLEKYSIALKSAEREASAPLIFGGGPVLTANPMPYKDFFDFIIIGDGEGANIEAVEICRQNKGKSKNEILSLLSKVEGIYVPSIKQKKVKKLTRNLTGCVYSPILSDEAFFKNTFILEISRGCSNCCGFCLASYLNLPARFVPLDEVLKAIDLGLSKTDKIALLGALIGAHPHFDEILNYISKKIEQNPKIEMSVSSLRADFITPNTIKTLVAAGQKSATIAIEAGSERLRKVINKHLSESQILETVKIARENGLHGLKIYCMLSLPTETQDDLSEIIVLAKKLKSQNKGFELTFSFSTFVPKAHTPFQWCGRDSIKTLESKINFLKKEFHKIGVNAKFSSAKWDYCQALLSRGDENFADFILEVYKNGSNLGAFKKAAKKFKITSEFIESPTPLQAPLPWDLIEVPPSKEVLAKEYRRLIG